MPNLSRAEQKLLDAALKTGERTVRGDVPHIVMAAAGALMALNAVLGLVWPWWSGGQRRGLDSAGYEIGFWGFFCAYSALLVWYNRFSVSAYSLIRKLNQAAAPPPEGESRA